MLNSIAAISLGASVGALLRWFLSLRLNSALPSLPLGTLASNLIGGYIVGLCVAYFASRPDLAPEVRLFAITGFCGGLTTFSTFSAEVVELLQRGDLSGGATVMVAHVAGSLCMTLLGLATWGWISAS
ncbi:MAG TPA: fluoride efflux transporter CrcB [Usitatibacter sp.]